MKKITFNNGRRHRGYRDRLFVGRGDVVHEFVGESIPGVCAVTHTQYEKNGKWSNTTYTLALADDSWSLESGQEWESGQRFHGCDSVAAVVALFRDAGCVAPDEAVVATLDASVGPTMTRIRATEEAVKSLLTA